MKVLSIGSDKKLFEAESAVSVRVSEYAKKLEALHIIVFNEKAKNRKENFKIGENIFVYPTNSFSKWMYVYDAVKIGKNIIRNFNFKKGHDVVTCQDPFEAGLTGYLIVKKFGIGLHLQIHTDFLSSYFKTSLLQRLRVGIARHVLPKASGVRVVSKRIADSIQSAHIALRRRPQILPIRVDAEAIEKAPQANFLPHKRHEIIMVSRLSPEKRIDDALSAFKEVLQEYPDTVLTIVGDGPEKKHLEATVKELGISDSVVFPSWSGNVPALLKSADVFLSTSEFEGYGMSVIEAGVAGCCVVSTDVGISGEILKDKFNAMICPVGDVLCFSRSIKQLIADQSLRETLSKQLYTDVLGHIPSQEEYIIQYVQGLVESV